MLESIAKATLVLGSEEEDNGSFAESKTSSMLGKSGILEFPLSLGLEEEHDGFFAESKTSSILGKSGILNFRVGVFLSEKAVTKSKRMIFGFRESCDRGSEEKSSGL